MVLITCLGTWKLGSIAVIYVQNRAYADTIHLVQVFYSSHHSETLISCCNIRESWRPPFKERQHILE